MGAIHLYGWDSDNDAWVKLLCDDDGKLAIDPALIFENPPTEDEAGKAASSEWSFDHEADVAAHHAKFTAAEARAAINDIFGAAGKAAVNINMNKYGLLNLHSIYFSGQSDVLALGYIDYNSAGAVVRVWGRDAAGDYQAITMQIYNGATYENVVVVAVMDTAILTHKNIVDAHHAKYTDAEALAACGLDGSLYWSCPGIHFDAEYPDTNDISKLTDGNIRANANGINFFAAVSLPQGATITKVIVYGNAAAEDENWYLTRMVLADGTYANKATENIGSEDITVSDPVVDNETYAYFIRTSSLDTDDEIYGARITYTL